MELINLPKVTILMKNILAGQDSNPYSMGSPVLSPWQIMA